MLQIKEEDSILDIENKIQEIEYFYLWSDEYIRNLFNLQNNYE